MESHTRLLKAFDYIRKTFFPRWDKERKWTVDLDWHLPSIGRCNRDLKKIVIGGMPKNQNRLYLWLIHEIGHVWCYGHAKKWQDRMLKAAQKADSIGNKILANFLRNEVNAYIEATKKGGKVTASTIYSLISDAMLEKPEESYEFIISWVAREIGLYPQEVEKRYKRCRNVYNRAQKKKKKQEPFR
jgi:hypothetical protein